MTIGTETVAPKHIKTGRNEMRKRRLLLERAKPTRSITGQNAVRTRQPIRARRDGEVMPPAGRENGTRTPDGAVSECPRSKREQGDHKLSNSREPQLFQAKPPPGGGWADRAARARAAASKTPPEPGPGPDPGGVWRFARSSNLSANLSSK